MVSSAVHQISAPIPAELYKQLKAMAADYNYDANCVAGDLLSIALTQALACLSDEDAQHVVKVRNTYQQGEMQCHQEVTRFDAGGT